MSYIFSVIIPVYNVEDYISDCLESIVQQTIGIEKIEVILINDCSTDGSLEIMKSYEDKYPSIRIINQEFNSGTGASRNVGLHHAKGKYISFVDADDFISVNTYEYVLNCFEKTKCDFVLYEYSYYSSLGHTYLRNPSASLFYEEKLITNIQEVPEIIFATSVCNKVFRRSLLHNRQFSNSQMEDVMFSTLTTFKANQIFVTNRCKYFYRKRENQLEKSKTDLYFHQKQNYLDHLQVNLELYELTKFDPKYKLLIDWFIARSILPFINYMFINRVFEKQEKRKFYSNVRELLLKINGDTVTRIDDNYSKFIFRKMRENRYHGFLIRILMKKSMNKIKKILSKSKEFYKIIDLFFAVLASYVYRFYPGFRDIWLVCERGDEAKDNGYYFFKYIRKNHPEINIYYLINKNHTKDYLKVKRLGNIVTYRSFKHKVLFILATKLISAHKGTIEPWNYELFKKTIGKIMRIPKQYVFLQHGITKDNVSTLLDRNHTSFNLFITGAKPEFNYVSSTFGYMPGEVVYTGFARFDTLYTRKEKNYVLLMPTWRKNLASIHMEDSFLDSYYYKSFQSLINNSKLKSWLEDNEFKLIFYPHYEMQRFRNMFSSKSRNIIVADKDSYDVQQLLKDSKLLITDYSSVFFDFAYMNKPVVYYQFDSDEFFHSHYQKGYFDYEKDGFGPVMRTEACVVEYIDRLYKNNFKIEDIFRERSERFFVLRDQNNCRRIYEAIKNSKKDRVFNG